MKMCYMAGAVKNAGDFLIEKRTEELIHFMCLETEIKKYKRVATIYDKDISELNNYVVFCFFADYCTK